MQLTQYQIDAFAARVFEGNPAAICPLQTWLPDTVMQAIALENNLSETAFFVPTVEGFHLRWFTPVAEVRLCGHATLASAYVIFNELGHAQDTIVFNTLSGPLSVTRNDQWLEMDFPAQAPVACATPPAIHAAFDKQPVACLKNEDYIVVFDDERYVRDVHSRNWICAAWPSPAKPVNTILSAASLHRTTASTKTRSPVRPLPSWCRTGPSSWGVRPFTPNRYRRVAGRYVAPLPVNGCALPDKLLNFKKVQLLSTCSFVSTVTRAYT